MRRLVLCTTCKFSAESKLGPDGRTGGETLTAAMRMVLAKHERKDVDVVEQACYGIARGRAAF